MNLNALITLSTSSPELGTVKLHLGDMLTQSYCVDYSIRHCESSQSQFNDAAMIGIDSR